ncbi:hypothetical protein FPV67DRAFT_1672274 [Lyophyllum atratum]|nr:hypothetical protein FPV67DRAFT_1672274 [Lyophyllum atratum]
MADSNYDSSFTRSDAVRRSMTRNSHYSHASTHSWVLNTQQNPPPPPEEPEPTPSPMRTPRPLPDPQLQPSHQMQVLHATNADPGDDEEEYMNIDANLPGMESGYRTEGLGRGRSPRQSPLVASPTSTRDLDPRSGRSFVGGFFNGLRRLPKVVLKYGTIGDKRKFVRRGTFGSGGTATSATGMTTGNTLPLYVSNPSTPVAGPSNTRYVQAIDMPVPFPAEEPPPVILGPSLNQRRRQPSFRLTPPEEVAEQDNVTVSQHSYPFPADPPQFSEGLVEPPRNANTVTVYHLPGQEGYPAEEPPIPLPTPTPNRRSGSQQQQPAQDPIPAETPSQTPVLAHPPPAADYRKMTLSSSPLSPQTLATSLTSEASFSSELNPVKQRVTVDYRPTGHGHQEGRRVKRPMSSWYRGTPGVVLSPKAGSGELDLLSAGSGSRRASTGTSSTPIASPPPARVRHRSSDHHRHRHREHHRRTHDENTPQRIHEGRTHHRHRDTTSTTEMYQQQGASPIIPAVYPYAYPYPYPYQTLPSPVHQRTHSQSTPRGPRPHRTQTYPHGYVQYQTTQPPPPPPMYVIHSPTQTNSSGEAGRGTQVLSPVYMPMQLVPGAYNQDQVTVSPPAGGRIEAGGA